MFGLFKKSPFQRSAENLEKEFGISLSSVFEPKTLRQMFERLTNGVLLNEAGYHSIYYRCVVMNILVISNVMKNEGKNISADDLLYLIPILNRAVDYAELSGNREQVEGISSMLNLNIMRFLDSFGIHNGSLKS